MSSSWSLPKTCGTTKPNDCSRGPYLAATESSPGWPAPYAYNAVRYGQHQARRSFVGHRSRSVPPVGRRGCLWRREPVDVGAAAVEHGHSRDRLGHDGEPGSGLGRELPEGQARRLGSGGRWRIGRRDRGPHQRHPRHRGVEPPHGTRGRDQGHGAGGHPPRRRSRSASTRWPSTSTKDNPVRTLSIEDLAEIYGDGGKIETWSQAGVANNGLRRRRDRARQPAEQLRHLRLLPRSGARAHPRAQTRLDRPERLEGCRRAGLPDAVRHRLQRHGLRHARRPHAGHRQEEGRAWRRCQPRRRLWTAPTRSPGRSSSTRGAHQPAPVKEFIDWTLSAEGQRVVQEIGYVPAPTPAAK